VSCEFFFSSRQKTLLTWVLALSFGVVLVGAEDAQAASSNGKVIAVTASRIENPFKLIGKTDIRMLDESRFPPH
ncbi:MAG: hypothetical protein ACLR7M_05315, partial [Varibaculum timonense]